MRHLWLLLTFALVLPGAAGAVPIPEGPDAADLPVFSGTQAVPNPVSSPDPPRHPFMAPNGKSNLHVDGYQSDAHQQLGPLGNDMQRVNTFYAADCASITFDSRGRVIAMCVGLARPVLKMLDPQTLAEIATLDMPPRDAASGVGVDVFSNFSGGGYFFLDEKDRVVTSTTTRHLNVISHTDGAGFKIERDYDLTGVVPSGDSIISALPDWSGRYWFASSKGVVGTVDPATGAIRARATGEPIGNSFAVDETRGVFIVTDAAMYRFEAGADGAPQISWRQGYPNIGIKKPGQTQAGSGTTPTVTAEGNVAITDNADPMNVVVYKKSDGSRVCSQPVFEKGASNTDQSLIAVANSLVVENNYGYTGPTATQQGKTTIGGLERVDVSAAGKCSRVWRSEETSPTVVPKASIQGGIVYTYTKDARSDGADAWYLTALDFRTGKTIYKRLGGEGLGHNNNYAPITIGPNGEVYLGVLGGMLLLRDKTPPTLGGQPSPTAKPRLKLRVRCGRKMRITLTGKDRKRVLRTGFYRGKRRLAGDRRAPFTRRIAKRRLGRPGKRVRLRARVVLKDGRKATVTRRVRTCR
ncbi:MAG: hypothetical protein H0V29_04410 [Thermoleophilaceae bacterium]|nr:hypothetical protein [Thermoleophilaceae bacterium]